MPRHDRRQLLKQLRGELPTVPERMPELRQLALSIVAQRHLLLMWVGVALMLIGQPVLSNPGIPTLTYTTAAFAIVSLLISGPLVLCDIRRAQGFLALHAVAPAQS